MAAISDDNPVYCKYCGQESDNRHAGRTHNGREHPDCRPDLRRPEDLPAWEIDIPLPVDVTPDQLANAVAASASLQGVLDALDWPQDEKARGRVRALVHSAGYYESLASPEAWDRDTAQQRGWA